MLDLENSFVIQGDQFNRVLALLKKDLEELKAGKIPDIIHRNDVQNQIFMLEYLMYVISEESYVHYVEDQVFYEVPCSEQTKLRLITILLRHI